MSPDRPAQAPETVKTGSHLKLSKETPLNNLFLSMLQRVGVKDERFGDSTGLLASGFRIVRKVDLRAGGKLARLLRRGLPFRPHPIVSSY